MGAPLNIAQTDCLIGARQWRSWQIEGFDEPWWRGAFGVQPQAQAWWCGAVQPQKRRAIIEEQDAKANEGMKQTMREVPIGKGLSGGLKYLQGRGALKESIELGGRNTNKKKSRLVGVVDDDDDVSIHIDRLDEFGRIVSASLFHYYVFFYFRF